MRQIATIAFLFLLSIGCGECKDTTIFAESVESITKQIAVGKSTKVDIQRRFGQPIAIGRYSTEIWTYQFLLRGRDCRLIAMSVEFDKDGIVKSYKTDIFNVKKGPCPEN